MVVTLLAVCAALVAPGCTRTDPGTAVADTEAPAVVSPGPTPPAAPTMTLTVPATPDEIQTPCVPDDLPRVRVQAEIPDPSAPTATVGVPEGWSMASGPQGARLDGPDGMLATVTVTPASPEAEAAFDAYVDGLTDNAVISSVSVLPGDLCGYPGQKLMGVLGEEGDGTDTVQYEARTVHVPTGAAAYLIAVYVQAPAGAAGFDEAATLLTADFEIGLP